MGTRKDRTGGIWRGGLEHREWGNPGVMYLICIELCPPRKIY